jgi:hypothetical protein
MLISTYGLLAGPFQQDHSILTGQLSLALIALFYLLESLFTAKQFNGVALVSLIRVNRSRTRRTEFLRPQMTEGLAELPGMGFQEQQAA